MQVFLCIKGYVVSFYHNICIVAAQCFIWLYKMDKMKWKTEKQKEKPNKNWKTRQKEMKKTMRKETNNRTDKKENKNKKLLYYIHLIYNKYAS